MDKSLQNFNICREEITALTPEAEVFMNSTVYSLYMRVLTLNFTRCFYCLHNNKTLFSTITVNTTEDAGFTSQR